MKKNERLLTGLAVGAVVAMFFIPKTRKLLSDAMCSITDSLKSAMSKAEDVMHNGGHIGEKV